MDWYKKCCGLSRRQAVALALFTAANIATSGNWYNIVLHTDIQGIAHTINLEQNPSLDRKSVLLDFLDVTDDLFE